MNLMFSTPSDVPSINLAWVRWMAIDAEGQSTVDPRIQSAHALLKHGHSLTRARADWLATDHGQCFAYPRRANIATDFDSESKAAYSTRGTQAISYVPP